MSVSKFLEELREKGIHLSLKGEKLIVRGEDSVLNEIVLGRLRESKEFLVELIRTGKYT